MSDEICSDCPHDKENGNLSVDTDTDVFDMAIEIRELKTELLRTYGKLEGYLVQLIDLKKAAEPCVAELEDIGDPNEYVKAARRLLGPR